MSLQPLTFEQHLAVAAYSSARTDNLKSSDTVAASIVALAISLAGVYGALVALAHARPDTPLLAIAAPFACFAVVASLGLQAQRLSVADLGANATITEIKSAVDTTAAQKRRWNLGALAALAVTFLVAGIVIAAYYRSEDTSLPDTVTAQVIGKGAVLLATLCGHPTPTVQVDGRTLASDFVSATASRCPTAARNVLIPKADVGLALPVR